MKAKLLLIILILPLFAGAQKNDTIQPVWNSDDIKYFHIADLDSILPKGKFLYDTSLALFHHHQPYSSFLNVYGSLGNTGLASYSLFYDPAFIKSPAYNMQYLSHSWFNFDSIKVYPGPGAFTDLYYVSGSLKEQILRASHAHSMKKNFLIGADYRLVNSIGKEYYRQKSNNSNTSLYVGYNSNDRRYSAIAAYTHNRIFSYENGGIVSDTSFENSGITASEYELFNAENRWKQNAWLLKHAVQLKFYNEIDSSSKDSVCFGRVLHQIRYTRFHHEYVDEDPLDGFYQDVLLDTLKTLDSINYQLIENKLQWDNLGLGFSGADFYIAAGLKNTIYRMQVPSYANIFSITSPYITLRTSVKGYSLHAYADYSVSDNSLYTAAYQVKARLSKDISEKVSLAALLNLSSNNASFNEIRMYGNHFNWSFDPEKENKQTIGFSSSLFGWKGKVLISRIGNYFYFDTNAMPATLSKDLAVFQASLRKDFVFRNWGILNEVAYQQTNSYSLSLPAFISRNSVYWETPLFKSALFLRIGGEVLYYSPYYAKAWMPATAQFYNQEKKKTGNYPYVDLYVNFKIKRARLFLKLAHLNSGFIGNRYYSAYHYLEKSRAIKFGISWRFFD